MARPRPVRVMISSRSNSRVFDGPTLADCRRAIKRHIEGEKLFEEELFAVWIHEDARASGGTDAWDESLEQVRRADVILVLYTGEAGWAVEASDVGICHAELMEAVRKAPRKVYMIAIERLAKELES